LTPSHRLLAKWQILTRNLIREDDSFFNSAKMHLLSNATKDDPTLLKKKLSEKIIANFSSKCGKALTQSMHNSFHQKLVI
jgi:hypothetical protein